MAIDRRKCNSNHSCLTRSWPCPLCLSSLKGYVHFHCLGPKRHLCYVAYERKPYSCNFRCRLPRISTETSKCHSLCILRRFGVTFEVLGRFQYCCAILRLPDDLWNCMHLLRVHQDRWFLEVHWSLTQVRQVRHVFILKFCISGIKSRLFCFETKLTSNKDVFDLRHKIA